MQTMRLWTSGVFSTVTNSTGPEASMPSSRAASLVSERRRALKPGSTQARATSLAPLAGERDSMYSICRRTSSLVKTFFSTRSASMALMRAA